MSIKKRSMVCTILLLAMFVVMCIPAMAAYNQVISLPANQVWMTAGNDDRSGAYSYVKVKNHSVYPASGNDSFSVIQCKITTSNGTLLCNNSYYRLEEGDGYTQIDIREGYLNTETVYFKFRGNADKSAKAVVSYYAP